jgi:hypothetical protein
LTAAAAEGAVVWLLLLASWGGLARAGIAEIGPRQLLSVVLTIALTGAVTWATVRAYADRAWLERAGTWTEHVASAEGRLRLAVGVFYAVVLLIMAALFGVSLRMNPDPASLLATSLTTGLPALVWLCLIAFHSACLLHAAAGKSPAETAKTFALGAGLVGLLLLYWYGAEGQLLHFNLDSGLTDQSAYLDYARRLKDSGYTYPGDFNRMPAFPFLLSLVWQEGMSASEFFLAAKYLNVFLSILLLAILAVLLFRRYGPLSGLNLVLIISFTVFLYKAGWVQAELLFYFLNTCLFLLLWQWLERPDLLTALGVGVVAGFAHLTKASVLPGLLVFAAFAVVRTVGWRSRMGEGGAKGSSGAGHLKQLAWLFLGACAFLVVLAPYLRVSYQVTSRYFYNVNSTFYIWYDSWEEAEAGTKAHGDRSGWPKMPASEIPTMAKYLREHTADQMLDRVVAGAREVMGRVYGSYGYFDYLMIYAGLLLVAAGSQWGRTRRLILDHALILLFFLAYFPLYFLLYFWYAPIVAGDRLILAQFIPLLLVLAAGVQTLLRGARLRVLDRSVAWATVVNTVILCLLVVEMRWALTEGVYVLRGGG